MQPMQFVLKAQWYAYWYDTNKPINLLYSFKYITLRSHTPKGQYDYGYSKASRYFKIKIFTA